MQKRLDNLRNELKKQRLDSLFITNQNNVTYLTGFEGLSPNEREAFLFVTQKSSYLLTFPTYYGLYCQGGEGFETLNITADKRLHHHLSEIISQQKIRTIGVEKENLTLGEFSSLKIKLSRVLKPTENLVETQRIIKDENEIKLIKKSAEITDRAFSFIKSKIKPGVTEKKLALELEFFLKKNADDIAFSPIVAFDSNAAIPHYLSSHNSRLNSHNLILLDFGAKIKGYCSDMTRVVFWGEPNGREAEIYHMCLKAQQLALDKIKPGIKTEEADEVARDYLIENNYPPYPHGLGHGVGLAIHESPRLKIGSNEILRKNMVVTVEPGIYIEGECGVRIEDLVVLREGGIEILSKSPKNITII